MAVRERGSAWQADVTRKGVRYRETFQTRKDAEAWEQQAREALRKGQPIPKPQAHDSVQGTMQELLDRIIALDWGRKPGTKSSIIHAQKFVQFVGPALSPAEAITQHNVDEFITELIAERSPSGSTVNRYLSAISKLMKRAMASGAVPRKLELPWQEEGEARLRWYSDEEEALILQTFRLWSRERHMDFFMCLLDTGARTWSELGKLQWRDVTASPRMVTFWDTKNGDSRAVPLTSRAWDAIQRQRPYGGAGPFVDICKDDSRRLYDRLRGHLPQLRDTVWYTARHTFASRLVQRGVDLYRVQKLLGHRSIQMTMRYAKLAPTHLIDAIGVLEPQAHVRKVVDNG